jgi:hypothetical protein
MKLKCPPVGISLFSYEKPGRYPLGITDVFSLLVLLGWCFTLSNTQGVKSSQNESPLSLCLGQALISGTPYSSCDMHTIHKNSLICIPDSYQASQYSPT